MGGCCVRAFYLEARAFHEGYSGVAPLTGVAGGQGKHAQKECDAFPAECATSLANKIKEVRVLQDTRASITASLTQSKVIPASAVSSAAETAKVMGSLHQRCDWLLQNFDVLQDGPFAGEVGALNNAEAELDGASHSF